MKVCHWNYLFKEGTPLKEQLYFIKNVLCIQSRWKRSLPGFAHGRQMLLLKADTCCHPVSVLIPITYDPTEDNSVLEKKCSEILYELFLKVTCRYTRPSERSTNADCYISPHPMGDLVTSSTAINLLVFYSFSPFLFFLLYASKLLFSRKVY